MPVFKISKLKEKPTQSCFVMAAIIVLTAFCCHPASSQYDEERKAKSLSVLNHITGWSLDSNGYHPAVFMLLENVSGRDLSGITIKMQGKFTDIHTMEPSTAKTEIRRALKPHQQIPIALLAPQGYELPRDPNFWPVMDCKVMARVGTVGDEGTEYLLVTKIDSVTATQEDSFQKLNEVTSYDRSQHLPASSTRFPPATPPRQPKIQAKRPIEALTATAAKLPQPGSAPSSNTLRTKFEQLTDKPMPGLGADFYEFEKTFGLPAATDAKKKDFTWARFRHNPSGVDIFVASKERSGKADLIAFVVPRSEASPDKKMIDRLKNFQGIAKSVQLGPVTRSVRYLPSGRLELTSSVGPGLKVMCMSLPAEGDRPASTLVMISRLGSDPDEVLRSHISGNEALSTLPLSESNH